MSVKPNASDLSNPGIALPKPRGDGRGLGSPLDDIKPVNAAGCINALLDVDGWFPVTAIASPPDANADADWESEPVRS